jgi:hypothetical protein
MSAQRSSSRSSAVCGIALLLLATLCCGDACERDTKISVEGGNPPTFRLSGNGNLAFLDVSDNSPNKVEKRSGETLWKIIPQSGKSEIGQLPPITYGQVPPGFNQVIPKVGEPPPLIAEKPYQVSAPTSNAHGDWVFFIIRDGAAAKVAEAN